MKKNWLLLIFTMVLCFACRNFALADEVEYSGTCGTNLTWTLTTDGTLTISGTGAMDDYDAKTSPWYEHRKNIYSIVIESGVTNVGSYAFFLCDWATELSLSETVIAINDWAFDACSFRSLTIPANVQSIGLCAFGELLALKEIYFEGSMPTMIDGAFDGTSGNVIVYYPADDSSWFGAVKIETLAGERVTYYAIISESTNMDNVLDGLILSDNGIWYYYDNGTLQSKYTGIVEYNGGYFAVGQGVMFSYYSGLVHMGETWYFLSSGQVQTQYTGLALYNNSWFYITEGILDTSKNGFVSYDGETFLVASGQLLTGYNGLWQYASSIGGDDKWYFIAAGQVQSVSQVVMYDSEFFVVENGMLASDYNGTIEYDGATFTVVAGQLY